MRKGVLRKLREQGRACNGMPAVAICGRPDWTADDLAFVCDAGFFVFFNEHDAVSTARRLSGDRRIEVDEAARILKQSIGSSKLVITLGRLGAFILNGVPTPRFSRATPVDNKDTTGAGDRLVTYTAIESAQGASDEEALDRSVRAVSEELSAR